MASPGRHEETKGQWQRQPVGGKEVGSGRLKERAWGMWLDKAIHDNDGNDCETRGKWSEFRLQRRLSSRDLLEKQHKMPMTLVTLNKRNGRKLRGIKITAQMIFHSVLDNKPLKSRSKESAKSTIRATQAASSSRVKRMLVAIRALRPKEMYARSEKVIRLGSRSMHFASSLAVYEVTAAALRSMTIPQSQPAYFMPMGKLKRPTPIRTLGDICQYTENEEAEGHEATHLVELKIV